MAENSSPSVQPVAGVATDTDGCEACACSQVGGAMMAGCVVALLVALLAAVAGAAWVSSQELPPPASTTPEQVEASTPRTWTQLELCISRT